MRSILHPPLILGSICLILCLAHPSPAQLTSTRPSQGLHGNTLDFVDVTKQHVISTVDEQSDNDKEVELGDFDNDGDTDVVIANSHSDFGQRRNKLYRNDNGTLIEVSGSPVIASFAASDLTRAATMRDYDNDGWLDLIIVNDSNGGDMLQFFHNKHPGGVFSHFVDESQRLGGASVGAGGASSADFDNDGDHDLFVAGHPFLSQDRLYLNDGTGSFTDVTSTHVPTDQDYSVDAAAGDINGDGKLDLLVSNMLGGKSFIYYNDALGQGSGVGDFQYAGSEQIISLGSNRRLSMEPGDFNNDGRVDIYVANKGSAHIDAVLQNVGNDVAGQAIFKEVIIGGFVSASESRKATVVDLNKDGRADVIVMGEDRRPTILRNTAVGNQISFVDWTPAPAFPTGGMHGGFHAAAFDVNTDGKVDIFVGGNSGEHLFRQRRAAVIKEAQLSGDLPPLHNASPVAILGNGVSGERDRFASLDIPLQAGVTLILRSAADVALELHNTSGVLFASSNRGGPGVEEALQLVAPAGGFTVDVLIVDSASARRPYILEILSRD